jgi:hypothetical protein
VIELGGKSRKMMSKNFQTVILLCCIVNSYVIAGVGESAVITLTFPYGARSGGMGETGTALADDESALYFNPAGLGVQNSRWKSGSVSNFREKLLPQLQIDDLWHYAYAGCVQPPKSSKLGGFGAYCNFIDMGENYISDAIGREVRMTRSFEAVFALGWGFNFAEYGDSTRHYGIAIKPFISALAPGMGENHEGTAYSFAVDIGLLRVFRNGLRFGFTVMNMGPNVFYVSRSQQDPIPFTLNCALAYKKTFYQGNIRMLDLAGEFRIDKELVVNDFDGNPEPFYEAMFTDLFNEPLSYEIQEINYHIGIELGVFNTYFYRQGFLFDYIGERYEMTTGAGLRLFRHLDADFSMIISPEGFLRPFLKRMDKNKDGATGVRNCQWRINFSYTGIGKFNKNDKAWWEE